MDHLDNILECVNVAKPHDNIIMYAQKSKKERELDFL